MLHAEQVARVTSTALSNRAFTMMRWTDQVHKSRYAATVEQVKNKSKDGSGSERLAGAPEVSLGRASPGAAETASTSHQPCQ